MLIKRKYNVRFVGIKAGSRLCAFYNIINMYIVDNVNILEKNLIIKYKLNKILYWKIGKHVNESIPSISFLWY